MRTVPFVILLSVLLSTSSYSAAQDFNIFEGKFTLHSSFGIPFTGYGHTFDEYGYWEKDWQYQVIFAFKMGNLWSFYSWDHFGIGMKMNWLEVSYTQRNIDLQDIYIHRFTVDFSAGAFGPLFIFAFNNKMCLDLYYNLRPTFMIATSVESGSLDYYKDYYEQLSMGFTNVFGCSYRFYVLSVGLEYLYGNLPDLDYIDERGYFDGPKLVNSCIRLVVGVAL